MSVRERGDKSYLHYDKTRFTCRATVAEAVRDVGPDVYVLKYRMVVCCSSAICSVNSTNNWIPPIICRFSDRAVYKRIAGN